jgi:hypothetical protein
MAATLLMSFALRNAGRQDFGSGDGMRRAFAASTCRPQVLGKLVLPVFAAPQGQVTKTDAMSVESESCAGCSRPPMSRSAFLTG